MSLFLLQLSFPDGTTLFGTIVSCPGYTTINAHFRDGDETTYIDATITHMGNNIGITGSIMAQDGAIQFTATAVSYGPLGSVISIEVDANLAGLGSCSLILNSSLLLGLSDFDVDFQADFDPEDLIDWLCWDDENTDIRDLLLDLLPFINGEEDLDGFEIDPFDTEEVPEMDDPPLNTFGFDQSYIGGRSSWLDSAGWLFQGVQDEEPFITALVHVPGFGHCGRVERIYPPGYVPVDVIVAQVLAGDLDGRGSHQL